MKKFGRGFVGMWLVLAALLLAGCDTDQANYKFDPLAQNPPPATAASDSGGIASTVPMADPTVTATDPTQTMLQKGDSANFSFSDTPNKIDPIDDTVKEDGTVTLLFNEKFEAAGKTIGALQQEIRDRYVPKYFKFLTVTIKTQDRFYYVGGEVRTPNRFIYSGRMTVLAAIDTAGGFNDFAARSRVLVTRANGETFKVDCVRALNHPELNREIFPGDKVTVNKRLW